MFSVTQPIILNFSLPFHAEKRVANLHVTATIANGEQVTLEHVLVTQSETLLTMQDYNPNRYADFVGELGSIDGTLTIGATMVSLNKVALDAGIVGSKQSLGGPHETVRLDLSGKLLDQHGEWILMLLLHTPTISGQSASPTNIGTLVFRFMVP
jgi:hypothetical protein